MKTSCTRGRNATRAVALGSLLVFLGIPLQAQVPTEATNLNWCGGTKDCLQWSASGATQYRLYRGEQASLPCLSNPALESCLESVLTETTTGAGAILETPAVGRFYWFLVTAENACGEGPSGDERLNGISQPRVRDTVGSCPLSCSSAGEACSVSSDCCSGACSAGCQAACCAPAGAACGQSADCCSNNCAAGTCQACFALGQSCGESGQCCSGRCSGGLCAIACEQNGGTCAEGSQCCSGICLGGTCQPLPFITSVCPKPLRAPSMPGQFLNGTVTIRGTAFQGGDLVTDGPLALLGSARVDPTGTVIERDYSIGCCDPTEGQVFHFIVVTPCGSASVESSITLSGQNGCP